MSTKDEMTPEMREMLGLGEGERLHPILTNAEVMLARAKAREKLVAEQKAAAMRDVEDRETRRLRHEEGLVAKPGPANEIVDITIDLPTWCAYLQVNMPDGPQYHHGHTYNVPRHVGDSLREMMARQWSLDSEVEGRSLTQHYGLKRNTVMNAITGAVTTRGNIVHRTQNDMVN